MTMLREMTDKKLEELLDELESKSFVIDEEFQEITRDFELVVNNRNGHYRDVSMIKRILRNRARFNAHVV